MIKSIFILFLFITAPFSYSTTIWEAGTKITTPRENIYQLSEREYKSSVERGMKHTLFYPVKSSDLLIPYEPLKTVLDTENEFIKDLLKKLGRKVSPFKSTDELFSWVGAHKFPEAPQEETPNPLPYLTEEEKALPMGATLFENENGVGITFGCAACHTSDLFGVKVVGLTNRFPRANSFFHLGATSAPYINSFLFRELTHATEGERRMFVKTKNQLRSVGTKVPEALGLDTSLAQVGLSLSKRNPDAWATPSKIYQNQPRPNGLNRRIADSKPAVWWNLKYKNKWLSDGSIVSGNPVHTNILWNEIGRGADLKKLDEWLKNNQAPIDDLTTAVFATKAPRYEKFFGVNSINLEKAKRGEKLFAQSCQKCHGVYEKGWNDPHQDKLTLLEKIQTTKVIYHEDTPVKNIGTDPGRYEGMKYFAEDLNRLQISKNLGVKVVLQEGYVPPPLVGIWSRWPYFHNNSIPNLCALLTPSSKRPVTYYPGAANNRDTDFDQECVGYPIGEKTPENWKKKANLFDTRKEGLSNRGHDERIFIKDGKEIFSSADKKDLIEFLKTL